MTHGEQEESDLRPASLVTSKPQRSDHKPEPERPDTEDHGGPKHVFRVGKEMAHEAEQSDSQPGGRSEGFGMVRQVARPDPVGDVLGVQQVDIGLVAG